MNIKKFLYIILVLFLMGSSSVFAAAGDPVLEPIVITQIESTDKSGDDGTLITGTAGTNTYGACWNADGDLVDCSGVPLAVADIDDTPVDGETAQPISSNYMYDHITDTDQHPEYMTPAEHTTAVGADYDTEAELLALFAAKADESIVGTSLNADDLELDGTILQTAAEIPHTDVAETLSEPWDLGTSTLDNITQITLRKLDDIQDTDASKAFAWGAYTLTHSSTTDGWGGVILHTNVADNASDTTLLTLQADDADDASTIFLNIIEDADGTPASLFKISQRTFTIGENAKVEGIKEYRIEGGADVMADDNYNGVTLGGKVAGSGVSAWNPVFLAADGKYDEADADNALYPAIGLAVLCSDATWDCDADDGLTILIQGVVRNEGWTGLTIGGNVFLSDDPTTTTGITQTAPSTSTDCVQKIGVALSDSEIFFNFTGEYYLVE